MQTLLSPLWVAVAASLTLTTPVARGPLEECDLQDETSMLQVSSALAADRGDDEKALAASTAHRHGQKPDLSALSLDTSASAMAGYSLDTFDCGIFSGAQSLKPQDQKNPFASWSDARREHSSSHSLNEGCLTLPTAFENKDDLVHLFDMTTLPGCSISLYGMADCKPPSKEVLKAKGRTAAWFKTSKLLEIGWMHAEVASVHCGCTSQQANSTSPEKALGLSSTKEAKTGSIKTTEKSAKNQQPNMTEKVAKADKLAKNPDSG